MKTMKKLGTVGLALMTSASLCACGGSTGSSDAAEVYNVGIVQFVQHPALDAATEGFKQALIDKLGEDAVTFDEQNASGETANCSTIVNGFISDDVDLIMANATPPLQAAAAATSDIPILGTSVTDYATALDIKDWTGTVGTNVSGTSDLAPLDQQAAAINELFPDAKKIGMIYCTGEANSVYQVTTIAGYLTDMGYEVTNYGFTDTNDVDAVARDAAANSDIIYIPTDNTAASNTEAISNAIGDVPVFAGEEGICAGCGVATLSISYYDLGYATGEMAAKILAEGADVSEMAVEFAPEVTKKYVKAKADKLGVAIPEGYEEIEA